jgi:septum site-determining protein MinC
MEAGVSAGAVLIPAPSPLGSHQLVLPEPQGAARAPVGLHAPTLIDAAALAQTAIDNTTLLGGETLRGTVSLEAGPWRLGLSQLGELQATLANHQLNLVALGSSHPHTHVAAAALGIASHWPHQGPAKAEASEQASPGQDAAALLVHRGTLRSGDHLQTEGTVLLLGDVNPGARISAGGHVLVWGRLRGIAHAGCNGDTEARIVALQLRPLQLRIAGAVARGPEGTPPAGLAEEARIVAGAIQIDPAPPAWPLNG